MFPSFLFGLFAVTAAQQVYISADGPAARPACSSPSPTQYKSSPVYSFSEFSYTQTETVRHASPVTPSPQPTYALPYSAVSDLFGNLTTISYGNWLPNASSTPTDTGDIYGASAWSALWDQASLPGFSCGIHTSTVSPTPVPTSELVLPPPLYFGPTDYYSFPANFSLGVAGSAVQVEGAIADEGRGPAAPDFRLADAALTEKYRHELKVTEMAPNYVAVENYYLYKQDITRLAAMGIEYYSFSISWSRILPFALPGTPVNAQGLQHYNDLVDFAISKGMKPIITLHHGDTPAALFDEDILDELKETAYFGSGTMGNGGFQRDNFEDAFVKNGKIVMSHFADRVPIWITINEPLTGVISGPSVDHVIKAHARLWHFYHDELQGEGQLSMKMSGFPSLPMDPQNASHVAVAQHWTDLNVGTLLDTLIPGKDYPEAYKMTVQDYVPLSPADLDYLRGTIDFVAADMYIPLTVFPVVPDIAACAADNSTENILYPQCVGVRYTNKQGWNLGLHPTYIIYNTAPYLRTQLNYFWNTYQLPIMITEFGLPINTNSFPESASTLQDIRFDVARSEYYLSYLSEVLKTIWEDGVDVMGALMWCFVDNWEWGTFDHAFGLQYVNRTTQERSYKWSFFDVVDFVETRRVKH